METIKFKVGKNYTATGNIIKKRGCKPVEITEKVTIIKRTDSMLWVKFEKFYSDEIIKTKITTGFDRVKIAKNANIITGEGYKIINERESATPRNWHITATNF